MNKFDYALISANIKYTKIQIIIDNYNIKSVYKYLVSNRRLLAHCLSALLSNPTFALKTYEALELHRRPLQRKFLFLFRYSRLFLASARHYLQETPPDDFL